MAVVWHLSSIQFHDKTLVSGVIMKKKPFFSSSGYSVFRNALMILSSYFSKVYSNKTIQVTLGKESSIVSTDDSGGFQVTFDFCSKDTPRILLEETEESLKVLQNYPINFDEAKGEISVISDIDETIMVSFTSKKIRRFFTTLFRPSKKRKVIPFTQELYKRFATKSPRFFYVSKSESNLFPTLSSFILHNKLPKGALFLTPYLSFWKLVAHKKESNFKLNAIRYILENSLNHSFVLIGDDSQRDLQIYYELATRFSEQISDIYIRQTGNKISEKHANTWNKLLKTKVNAYYFKPDEIFDNLNKFN